MEHLLTEELFKQVFIGNDFVFLLKKDDDDYRYIRLNEAAQSLFPHDVIGQTISEVVPKRNDAIILENYNKATQLNEQIDYVDYAYYEAEVRKYETSVRPFSMNDEQFILAITKEILYDRNIEDKFLFMRSMFDHASFSTVILSETGEIFEVNSNFMEDFGLCNEHIKQQSFSQLPIIPDGEFGKITAYIKQASKGETITKKILSFQTLEKEKRYYVVSFSPVMQGDNSLAIFLIMHDITEFAEQKAELRIKTHGFEVFKAALNSAAGIVIFDIEGHILDINKLLLDVIGYTKENLVGTLYDFIESRNHPVNYISNMKQKLEAGEIWRGELCYRTKYHAFYWMDVTIIPLKNEEGITEQFLSINYDITDKKRMLTELKNIERTFRLITENTNDLIVITNEDGIIMYTSPSYTNYLGFESIELQGRFYSSIVADISKKAWQNFLNNVECQSDSQFELLLETKDNLPVWTEGNVTVVKDSGHEKFSQIIMVSREITHRKERENDLLYLAYHDSLTQLPNRRFLLKEFPKILADANRDIDSLAMIYIDGDNFKEVNDQFGHETGDAFIRKFGSVLKKSIRHHDLVIRIGGDEFIVVLTGLSRDVEARRTQMMQIICRIRNELQIGWTIEQHQFTPTASMGIAYYPDHAKTLDKLMDLADQALYKAKEIGKNNLYVNGSTPKLDLDVE
ncbi:diguanylate cyclase domain-containing protein [Lysinibacillus sp. NPDC096418]|uniref:diguanylate cyclase domain-containing protein n=1 Tax=Lysinibacillus sp. NPDC096418 TaxID=3364138 RepID=UPI00382EFB7E